MSELIDLTGQRFGRLTVTSRADTNGGVFWNCVCDCGGKKIVRSDHLKRGFARSCGCLQKETMDYYRHRFLTKNGKLSKEDRIYKIWCGMKKRCTNTMATKWNRYGGRGISICKEWEDFFVFKEWALSNGYADNLSIDRIDNDGNYSPENCRWATAKEQSNNTSRNHVVTINGEPHTLSEWSAITGINAGTLWKRAKSGITDERFLSKGDLRNGRELKQAR